MKPAAPVSAELLNPRHSRRAGDPLVGGTIAPGRGVHLLVGHGPPGRLATDQARLLAALRADVPPLAQRVQHQSYLELQRFEDEQQCHRLRRYWKGHFLRELGHGAIDASWPRAPATTMATRRCCRPAASRATAVRSPRWATTRPPSAIGCAVVFVAVAGWTDPAEEQPRMSAARRYAGAVEPCPSGVYVNALADEGQTGIRRACWGRASWRG